jgi:hypothetical protein
MIPWGLLGQGLKSGLEIYKNKKAADVAMSEAKLLHIEKMKRGEIEFSGKIAEIKKIKRIKKKNVDFFREYQKAVIKF